MRPYALPAAVLLSYAALAPAADFDCSRAASRVEKMVCADAELSLLDEYLGRYYAAGRDVLDAAAPCLQSDQKRWLAQVRDACDDRICLKGAYLDRLAELDPLQPGVTTIKDRELPKATSLAWIIPPAADKVAAPANPRARPFEAQGSILNEVENGDGYVLRTPAGERYLLMMLMFLDGPSQARLEQMARDKGALFRVTGHLAPNPGGKPFFEPSRCAFIHRVADVGARPGRVYGDAVKPFPGSKPHELPFARPTDGVPRAEFRSESFYAVILKTAKPCSVTERERLDVQALFPANKVFSQRFYCDENIEENINYTNVNEKVGFIAVYAGATQAQAEQFLDTVKKTGRFPGANLRRMQAVLVYP